MKTLLQIILFLLFGLATIAQPNKSDIRTTTKCTGCTGVGFIRYNGTAVDTSKPHTNNVVPFYNGTSIVWVPLTGGTVSSVATGIGLTGGTITTTGTISLDTASSVVLSRQRAANEYATIGSVALKLNISDTAAMLANYSTSGDLALKLSISDTAAMLSNYLQTGVAAATYAPISVTGSVTSVAPGYGTNFTTITTTGSVVVDSSVFVNKTGVQLLTNKFISGSTNTFSNIPNSALTNSTISGVSLGGTLGAHSVSYGLSGSNYTGAGAIAWTADTTSATALASKTRLTNTLGAYVNALSAIGASANANGATITGSTLNLQPASASFGGVVTTGTQTLAGAKTFSSTVTGSASPAFTVGTYGTGIRGTASGNTTWLQMEQAGGNAIAIYVGNTVLDYNQFYVMDPGGTLNVNNFEFTTLGSGYASSGLASANSTMAWTRSGLTNGFRVGTQAGPLLLFTGGFATTNERVRILSTGEMAVSGTATPLTAPTAHLHIAAGAAGAGKAPLKFSSGTDLTTAEAGAWEYDGTNLHFSPSTTRLNVALYLPGSAALDFASTAAQSSSDLTITVTGAADGDPVILGTPNAATLTNSCYTSWVSAVNTVTIRFSNYSAGAQDPASATFKVKVVKN